MSARSEALPSKTLAMRATQNNFADSGIKNENI